MTSNPTKNPGADPPQALVGRGRGSWWPWLIPLAASVFAVSLAVTYVVKRGPMIVIVLSQGRGVETGALVRCRGVAVGEVELVALNEDYTRVEAHVRLIPQAAGLARAGSRFWLVRPQVNVNEISGLETLAGARYLAVAPGRGPPQRRFVALKHAPAVETIAPDGLEIQLTAAQRGSIRPGTRFFYRQTEIGTVLSVGLASDAASVEIRGYIEPAYVALVRENSQFWNVSGLDVDVGFGGLKLEVDSLQSVIAGGIAMATPDPPGKPANTGRRFVLHDKPKPPWLAWRPRIPIGAELLPGGTPRPNLVRMTVYKTKGRLIARTTQRRGWLLPVEGGLVGPAALLRGEGDTTVEVLGHRLVMKNLTVRTSGRLAELVVAEGPRVRWPAQRIRTMEQVEACVVLCDAATPPIPLAAERLTRIEGGWRIDPSVSLDESFSGAAAISRRDGRVVGLVVVGPQQGAMIADWPAAWR